MNYANSVNQNLICSICQQPFEDPVTISGCEHTFCRACLQEYVESIGSTGSPPCPLDRQPFSPLEGCKQANIIIRNMVDELIVYCPNYSRIKLAGDDAGGDSDHGVEIKSINDPICRWTGQRILLASHLEHNCPIVLHERRLKDMKATSEAVTVDNMADSGNSEMMEYLICAFNKLQAEQEQIRQEMDSIKLEFSQMRISPAITSFSHSVPSMPNKFTDLQSLAFENEKMRADIVQHLHSITSQQQAFLYPELVNMRHQIDRLNFMFGEMHHRSYLSTNGAGNNIGDIRTSLYPSATAPRTAAAPQDGNSSPGQTSSSTSNSSANTSSTTNSNRPKL